MEVMIKRIRMELQSIRGETRRRSEIYFCNISLELSVFKCEQVWVD